MWVGGVVEYMSDSWWIGGVVEYISDSWYW